MINRAFIAFVAVLALSFSAGCATTVRTPFGTYREYRGRSSYTPAPSGYVYHHSESGPGFTCRVYSSGTGDRMRFTRRCSPNR